MRRALTFCLVAGLASLAACTASEEAASPAPSPTATDDPTPDATTPTGEAQPEGPITSRMEPVHLQVTVSGDEEFEWESDVELLITGGELSTDLHFLSIGLENLEAIDDSRHFRLAFDLVGPRSEEGTYEIPAGQGMAADEDEIAGPGELSNAFLITAEVEDPDADLTPGNFRQTRTYSRTLEPCQITLGADESTGTVRCPALEGEDNSVVSVTWEWEV
ncbi:MAG: hypothetical protein KY469_15900 [Actinobacteria bacterium]|nr:hypothetical protein [Actinomycetota bacterium]